MPLAPDGPLSHFSCGLDFFPRLQNPDVWAVLSPLPAPSILTPVSTNFSEMATTILEVAPHHFLTVFGRFTENLPQGHGRLTGGRDDESLDDEQGH